jgi:hypothetical protein
VLACLRGRSQHDFGGRIRGYVLKDMRSDSCLAQAVDYWMEKAGPDQTGIGDDKDSLSNLLLDDCSKLRNSSSSQDYTSRRVKDKTGLHDVAPGIFLVFQQQIEAT